MDKLETLLKVKRPESLKDIAFKTIKDSIIKGSLRCGEVYSGNVLSKTMGISQTPIKSALLELSHKGFIEILPKKGFLVKDLSEKEIRDIYDFRLALERVIFKNAAEKSRRKDIVRLESLLNKLKGSRDVMTFMEKAINFHRYLAQLNGNEQIIQALNGIWDLCIWIGFQTLSPNNDLDEILGLHYVMLDHIKNKDSKAAEAAIEEHINSSLNRIFKVTMPN